MSRSWTPEREITVAEARERVHDCGIPADDIRIVAAGWDNTVVLVDDTWVFRFPRREVALPGIEREIAILPRLSSALSLPVPVPEHVGAFGDPPWRFWGGRYLPGTELAVSPHADRAAVATAIGGFLAELHGLPADPALPVDPFGRADAATRAVLARDVLVDLQALGIVHATGPIDAVLAAAEGAGPAPTSPVLSHGDLYARHVLVDEDGLAAAVIDWGDLCLAPAAVDLSMAYSAFGGPAREAFFAEYGPVDADTELRARVMAIFSAASVAHYAHDQGDSALLAEAVTGLERAAS